MVVPLCERQWALYGIQCVLRIFWQTWLYILTKKGKKLTLCKHVPCNTLTHSTNEDLLNIKRKGDPEVLYPLSYVRYHWNPEPLCNKSHFVSLFYLYWYFYPLANEVAKGYSKATVRSFRLSFCSILMNTLGSTSFNGFDHTWYIFSP